MFKCIIYILIKEKEDINLRGIKEVWERLKEEDTRGVRGVKGREEIM